MSVCLSSLSANLSLSVCPCLSLSLCPSLSFSGQVTNITTPSIDFIYTINHPSIHLSLPPHPSLSIIFLSFLRTGNKSYDAILPDLPALGYRPLTLIAKGRSGTILLAQDIRESTCRRDSECKPVAIKLQSGRKRKQPANLRCV